MDLSRTKSPLCLISGNRLSNEAVKPLKLPQAAPSRCIETATELPLIQPCSELGFMHFIFVLMVKIILRHIDTLLFITIHSFCGHNDTEILLKFRAHTGFIFIILFKNNAGWFV